MTEPVIHRVTTLDLTYEPWDWPFATRRRADIDAHFAAKKREKPNIWNGQVLLARRPGWAEGRFSASYFATDFASFLAWRDWGFVDASVFNSFGMGALLCADGAFVMGEMSRQQAAMAEVLPPLARKDDHVGGRSALGMHRGCPTSGSSPALVARTVPQCASRLRAVRRSAP